MTTSVGNNSVFKGFFEKQKISGPNFIDWYRQLRLVLSTEDKENYLEHPIPTAPVVLPRQQVHLEALAAHAAWVKGQKEFDTVREFHTCKQEEGQSVSSHVLKMKGYIDNLERLGQPVRQNLAKAAKGGHGKSKGNMGYAPNNAPFAPKPKTPPPPKKDNPAKDAICHQCGEVGHWRRNCLVYLAELMKKKKLSQGASTLGSTRKKTIKSLRSDRGGEYMSQEFLDHLKEHGIISHHTPPYTSQNNRVSERRNQSLLDMVRSMMSQTTLPKSFWDYALMVPTKKRDTLTKPDKLDPRSFKCIFIGYPKETMGYSFYSPSENKLFIARNAEFFDSKLLDLKASGSVEDLELIQEEDTNPSVDTSLNYEEDDQEIDEPQSDINPIRRSTRTRCPTDRLCLYIDAEEHKLGDLGEPTNYKAALLDLESKKWLDAMNVEIQSMKDNYVWVLVELPPNARTVGSKWLFKKKTNMDDIRAIRILIAIAAYYDYEIWQMDAKTAFLNGHLPKKSIWRNLRVLSKRLIGLCQSAYIEKILKRYYMENSKRRTIPMQEKLKLSKSQGASTPVEKQRMQNISYPSAIGSIMYAVRSNRPDVAFAQNMTSRFQQNPGKEHWTAVKNILKYLRNIKDMFLVYGGAVDWKSTKQSIFATSSTYAEYIAAFDATSTTLLVNKGFVPPLDIYLVTKMLNPNTQGRDAGLTLPGVDVDEYQVGYDSALELIEHLRAMGETNAFVNQVKVSIYLLCGYFFPIRWYHPYNISSTSGWIFLLGGGAISWASKKPTCITSSTMESEFVALAAAGNEAEWLRNLIYEIPLWPKQIPPFLSDVIVPLPWLRLIVKCTMASLDT
nr:hypothetical protein [Tanacetum cinerariifolium]